MRRKKSFVNGTFLHFSLAVSPPSIIRDVKDLNSFFWLFFAQVSVWVERKIKSFTPLSFSPALFYHGEKFIIKIYALSPAGKWKSVFGAVGSDSGGHYFFLSPFGKQEQTMFDDLRRGFAEEFSKK